MTVTCATRIFLAICLFGVALAARPGDPDFRCTPGESFKDDCNQCRCLNDGKNYVCTLKACRPTRETHGQPGQAGFCEPGTTFQQDCNTCTCSPNGKNAFCTLIGCQHKRDTKDIPPNTPGFSCTPGEHFKYQCNNCICAKDGKTAGCNLAYCPPGTYKRKRETNVQNEANCKDGEEIKRDCNSCHCIPGVGFACTKKSCPKSKRDVNDEANCKDGEVIKRDCNNCRCIPGVGFACTKRSCPKEKREVHVEHDFNGTACAPNDKFMVDCNTCYCNSDGSGYSCTEKLCASPSQT